MTTHTDNRDQFERYMDKQFQDEKAYELNWTSFKHDAVSRVSECLENNGDLVDLLNTLDLEFDKYDSLSNSQICEIVLEATKMEVA